MLLNEQLKKPAKCECGSQVPWHLVAVGDKRFSHICSCENHYAFVDRDTLVYIGKRANPFTQYDKEHGSGSTKK